MPKKIACLFAPLLLGLSAHAADFFQEGKLRPMKAGESVVATDTIGGYPIFQDDGRWVFVSGREWSSSGGQTPIKMGNVLLDYLQGNYLLARQSITASVDPGGTNNSWSGTPCSPDHLYLRNLGKGRQDNCMTIDPKIITLGTTPTLFLNVVLTNAGSSGRYYQVSLYVNADLLGVRSTGLGDWTQDELKAKPYKKDAFDRLVKWAEPLQDGSIRALDYAKPQDVYAQIPSLMTLLPVPDDLAGKKQSISFLSAVEHLRHQSDFKSIAYAHHGDYKGTWNFVFGQSSQDIADATALANCEDNRKKNRPDAPACTVYRLK